MYRAPITGYTRPVEKLPGSIMSLSNTGGAGRGGSSGTIIGDVIAKGKKMYWARGENYFYHCTLGAGENTLEARLARLTMRSIADAGSLDPAQFWDRYVAFLTADPPAWNDAYVSSAHRMFFQNRAAGKPLAKCPDNDGHNVDAIDTLTLPIPAALFAKDDDAAEADTRRMVSLTRDSKRSEDVAVVLARMLRQVVRGADLSEVLQREGASLGLDLAAMVRRRPEDAVVACYLDSSVPAALAMAYKYSHTDAAKADPAAAFKRVLLANANRGGENVAAGAVLGSLFGAWVGVDHIPKDLMEGLDPAQADAIRDDVDAFVKVAPFAAEGGKSDGAVAAPAAGAGAGAATRSEL